MLSFNGYIEQSLRTNLFFLRISKEHSFFLESSFTQRSTNLKETAGYFRRQFKLLLQQAVSMADGALDQKILQSGQIVTINTLPVELLTQRFTGTVIDTELTKQEERLQPGIPMASDMMESRVNELNRKAIAAATALAEFIVGLISDVKTCRLFINVFPLMLDHMLRETNVFIRMLAMLQNRVNPLEQSLTEQELFWNQILGEHAAFTGAMLDPTEKILKNAADKSSQGFYALADTATQASIDRNAARSVTEQSLQAAIATRGFSMALANGQLHCQILSALIPLAVDHNVREINFYIYQIEEAERISHSL